MQRRKFIQSTVLASFCSVQGIAEVSKRSDTGEVTLINAGVGGNNTVDLLARIEKDCLSHHPELTTLMVGTNDMNSRKYIHIDVYEKNLQQLINRIKKVNSTLLLMNLLPVHEPYLMTRHNSDFYKPEGHAARLEQMNARIKKLAIANDVLFLDLHHIFKTIGNIGTEKNSLIKNEANSDTTDGLHPTPDGYRVIGLAVYHSIIQHRPTAKKIVCFGDSITAGDGIAGGFNYPSYLKKLLS